MAFHGIRAIFSSADEPKPSGSPSRKRFLASPLLGTTGILTAIFAAMAILFVAAGFLTGSYRALRQSEAMRAFRTGQDLAREGRAEEAIGLYRVALSLARDNPEYRLALALALQRVGQIEEAQTRLSELLQADPTNGVANFSLARIASQRGDIGSAETYYHRAIYGLWPTSAEANRLQARFELVELLAATKEKQKLQAELLMLQDEVADDPNRQKRVAQLFLLADSPSNAASLFRTVLSKDQQDAEAYAGLGEAEFQQSNLLAAQRAWRTATRLNPENSAIQQRLDLVSAIVAMDPTLPGLRASERYARSRRLLALALARLDLCVNTQQGEASPPVAQITADAQRRLAQRSRASQYQEIAEANSSLAIQVWQARQELCPQLSGGEEAVALLLNHLARAAQ